MSTRFQIEAFIREFTALFCWPDSPTGEQQTATRTAPLVRDDRVEDIRVARVTPELLELVPARDTSDGNCVGIDDDQAVFLLAEDFSVLAEVRQNVSAWTPQEQTRENGETVGEAIARLRDPGAVKYILERRTGDEIEERYSVGGYAVTLYKAPKGWTIPEWVAQQIARATAVLRAQVAEIDSVGAQGTGRAAVETAIARAADLTRVREAAALGAAQKLDTTITFDALARILETTPDALRRGDVLDLPGARHPYRVRVVGSTLEMVVRKGAPRTSYLNTFMTELLGMDVDLTGEWVYGDGYGDDVDTCPLRGIVVTP